MRSARLEVPGRERSMDRSWVVEVAGTLVVGVADGAGGTGGGALAAQRVEDVVREAAASVDVLRAETWASVLRVADQRILADGHGGLSTGVIVAVTADRVVGASVGDSGAWLVDGDAIEDLTASQRRRPALGSGSADPVTFSAVRRGRLLVATDGLLAYARRDRIVAVLRDGLQDDVPAALVDLARTAKGTLPDDVAVLVVG